MVVFQERNCLHTFKHGVVRRVTELHLSTNFYALIRELRELNQNKEKEKNSEIDYFQFNTFPGQKPGVPFEHMYRFNLLEVLYTTN